MKPSKPPGDLYGAPYGAPYGPSGKQVGGEGPGSRVEQYGGRDHIIENEVDETLSDTLLTSKDFLYLLKKTSVPKRDLRFIENYISAKSGQKVARA
jgi:hypothetical protein